MKYYQIIKNGFDDEVYYTVRKAINVFGFIISIPGSDRWLSGTDLYAVEVFAQPFLSIENAELAIKGYVKKLLKEKERLKNEIVATIKI